MDNFLYTCVVPATPAFNAHLHVPLVLEPQASFKMPQPYLLCQITTDFHAKQVPSFCRNSLALLILLCDLRKVIFCVICCQLVYVHACCDHSAE